MARLHRIVNQNRICQRVKGAESLRRGFHYSSALFCNRIEAELEEVAEKGFQHHVAGSVKGFRRDPEHWRIESVRQTKRCDQRKRDDLLAGEVVFSRSHQTLYNIARLVRSGCVGDDFHGDGEERSQ